MSPPQQAPSSSSLGGLTANAVSLVRSARESEWLPNYDAQKIRSVVKEMGTLTRIMDPCIRSHSGDLFQRLLLAQHVASRLPANDDDDFGGSNKTNKRASLSPVVYLDAILRNRQCTPSFWPTHILIALRRFGLPPISTRCAHVSSMASWLGLCVG